MVLDADGLSKLARRDRRVREMVREEFVRMRGRLVVPWVIVIQALNEGIGVRAIDEVLARASDAPGIDRDRAVLASGLMRVAVGNDVPDALVASEALLAIPAIVVTSDPGDLRKLLDADPRGKRVEVWAV